ncbi:Centrosomal protein of 41 kDa [Phytophthora pseudosyringae]|uniref:Centrosomal protein of 41 kDa n=1 Tax=Phytophthora pseudosyringae TaxID=221518 RepID=A0A8T1VDQ4_9STRA|nr:Centrosomal protein of 41 kDa [Phytophthora pseudosyringae]
MMPQCACLRNRTHAGPGRNRIPSAEFAAAEFSLLGLRVCWLVFIGLHAFCGLYFACMALTYWKLPGTTFGRWLYFYDLGLPPEDHRTISVVHGVIAAVHVSYLLWMIGWSIEKRQLVFAVFNVFGHPTAISSDGTQKLTRRISNSYRALIAKIGLIRVDGPYFDLVLLCREILETSLQTHQAYRMSQLLPRSQLNRSYISLLVVNCWSTTIVHFFFHGSDTKRRFYAIVCDCILDLVTSVGISIALLALYLPDFDFDINDFPVRKWYEDVWVMHIISELQILMVTSWSDLAMRVVFALSMIMNMHNMKKLLSPTMITPLAGSEKSCPSINRRLSVSAVVPQHPSLLALNAPGTHRSRLKAVITAEEKLTQPLFFMWGVIILALHLYAESIAGPPQCRMQVKPWMISEPACSLLVLDCHESNLTGTEAEVVAQWSSFDPTTTAGVVIRHCPSLEVPDILTKFSRLKLLKFYNSTITSWDETAALSQTHHPNIIMLFLVRVTLPDGLLPAGAQSVDFPQGLGDIEICHTNLRTLPEDLDTKWPQLASIYIEACELTEVPPSLARLAPYDLSLAMNLISNIPPRLLEGELVYLHIGATSISELPEQVHNASPLEQIRVDNTNISFFWSWIDPVIESAGAVLSDVPTTIVASNTPYCADLQRIFDGEETRFSAVQHDGQSTILSDASEGNWGMLKQAVECGEWPTILYPIDAEDEYNGIKTVQP